MTTRVWCPRFGILSQMRTAVPLAVLLLGSIVPSAVGQEQPSDHERFQLFNDCQPMGLIIERLPDSAKDLKLTTRRLRTVAESRLRSARLYDASAFGSYFYVNVNLVRQAFNLNVEYHKLLHDRGTDMSFKAKTWGMGFNGIAARTGGDYIVSTLSEYMDQFLIEYLRVNESACK